MRESGVRRSAGFAFPGARASAAVAAVLVWGACGGDGPAGPGNGDGGPPPPAISLSMALGELRVLNEAAEVRAFEIESADGAREYLVAVQSAAQTAGARTPMRLRVRSGSGGGASIAPAGALEARSPRSDELSLEERATLGESVLKRNMRREIERVGARAIRPGERPPLREADPGPPSFSVAAARQVPQVGDTLEFIMAVKPDLSVDCSDTDTRITAVVKEVGSGFALVEDTAVAGNFSSADYQDLGQELDDLVYPVNTAYWGTPADIDGNERSIVLFTAEVNKLTEGGSLTFIAGFFWPGDLSPKESCAASNEAEILYILAPDPQGEFGDDVSVSFAKRNARGVTAHEFQHLLTAQQRVTKGGGTFADLEDTWLSEGYAHIAEEVAGLKFAGLRLRDDLTFQEGVSDVDAFNAFHLSNFVRLAHYMLTPPATPAIADEDPGGFESLRMRGFAWAFLRWLADHHAPDGNGIVPGAQETVLFRELSDGNPGSADGRGIENVLRALQVATGTNRTWPGLLGEFASMPPLTDTGPDALPEVTQLLTWDLRSMFEGLNQSNLGQAPDCSPFCEPYPIDLTEIDLDGGVDRTVSFEIYPSAQKFFLLRGANGPPDVVVELTTSTGDRLPESAAPQVTVVRSQ